MVTVSDGKSKPVPMRLHLSMEVLKLQREDLEVKCLSMTSIYYFVSFDRRHIYIYIYYTSYIDLACEYDTV